jgi:hypothetical protein
MVDKRKIRLTKTESQRLTVRDVLIRNLDNIIEGDLSDIIRNLSELEYPEYDSLCIERNPGYEQSWLEIVGYKLESDEQYNKRIEKLKAKKHKDMLKEERAERKLLKMLMKKYKEPDSRNKKSKEELGLS